MKTPVLVSWCQFLIVTSLVVCKCHAASPSALGEAMSVLVGTPYHAHATEQQTMTKTKASCISAVVYGLRKLGYPCPYLDFLQYRNWLLPHAVEVEWGKTPITGKGMILFSGAHFAALYKDSNANGVIDQSDAIIHALFNPVEVTPISAWLAQDQRLPVHYVALDNNFDCGAKVVP